MKPLTPLDTVFVVAGYPDDAADARTLLELRGYQVVDNIRDVNEHLQAYGYVNSPRNVRAMITDLMRTCHVVVLHGDLEASLVLQYIKHCHLVGMPCLHWSALPLTPTTSMEAIDQEDLTTKEPNDVDLGGSLQRLGQRAAERVRQSVRSAYDVWMRFEMRFNARYGWFFTNGRKHHRRVYEEPGALSTTG